MSLEEQLAGIRAGAVKRMPPEKRAVMAAATEALGASGILDGAVKVGERLPDFSLPDAQGNPVTSGELLAHGPLVVTYFRGVW
jgi:hypothetical protein